MKVRLESTNERGLSEDMQTERRLHMTPPSLKLSEDRGILEGVEPFHAQGNFHFFLKKFLKKFFRISALSAPIKKRMPILKKLI